MSASFSIIGWNSGLLTFLTWSANSFSSSNSTSHDSEFDSNLLKSIFGGSLTLNWIRMHKAYLYQLGIDSLSVVDLVFSSNFLAVLRIHFSLNLISLSDCEDLQYSHLYIKIVIKITNIGSYYFSLHSDSLRANQRYFGDLYWFQFASQFYFANTTPIFLLEVSHLHC